MFTVQSEVLLLVCFLDIEKCGNLKFYFSYETNIFISFLTCIQLSMNFLVLC